MDRCIHAEAESLSLEQARIVSPMYAALSAHFESYAGVLSPRTVEAQALEQEQAQTQEQRQGEQGQEGNL